MQLRTKIVTLLLNIFSVFQINNSTLVLPVTEYLIALMGIYLTKQDVS